MTRLSPSHPLNLSRALKLSVMSALAAGVLSVGVLAPGAWTEQARAELLELENGRMLQGDVIPERASDEGLAFRLFSTGGVTTVRWDHILEERSIALQKELGIIPPTEDDVEYELADVVLLTNAEEVVGKCMNPTTYTSDGKLQVKTARGVRSFDAAQVQKIETEAAEVEATDLYTIEELYQRRLEEMGTLDGAAQHSELAAFCTRIRDYAHAEQHFEAAWAETEYRTTSDGRSIPKRLDRVKTLIAAQGAEVLVTTIKGQMRGKKWNEALATLDQLATEYPDDKIREAVRYDVLARQVVNGRDKYFRRKVQLTVYKELRDLVTQRARLKKSARDAGNEEKGRREAAAGTLAAAMQWAARDLPKELWGAVATSAGLETEEIDKYWTERTGKQAKSATYGSGTFILVEQKQKKDAGPRERRRPPGANRDSGKKKGGKGEPNLPQEADPITPEQWWAETNPNGRTQWLIAYFVENSEIFELMRVDESNNATNPVNGIATIRTVVYR